jgi:hypothetical protein
MSKDLVVLVADVQQEKTLETLLKERSQSLGIRTITFDIYRHPRKDAGVYHEAADFLAAYRSPQYQRALVLLDWAWDGAPGNAAFIQQELLTRLQQGGWPGGRAQVIVLEPELEIWIWATSSHVPEVLRTSWDEIHILAQARGYWLAGHNKPSQPKELLEAILKRQHRPRSAAIFQELVRRVGFARCQDPAFLLLCQTLKAWFAL